MIVPNMGPVGASKEEMKTFLNSQANHSVGSLGNWKVGGVGGHEIMTTKDEQDEGGGVGLFLCFCFFLIEDLVCWFLLECLLTIEWLSGGMRSLKWVIDFFYILCMVYFCYW